MPLTLAHPAVVLPFSRKSKYINFIALVIGTMSPDFEYFLNGMPSGTMGHSISNFFIFHLPLIAVFYLIYVTVMHCTVFAHLPKIIQVPLVEKKKQFSILQIIVFIYSAFIGMLSHIVWDSFTHIHGFVVLRVPLLTETIFQVPIYKLLQHGGTLVGLFIILIYMIVEAKKNTEFSTISAKEKFNYWLFVAGGAIVLFIAWYVLQPVSLTAIGALVVRVIDCGLISLLLVSIFIKYKQLKK